MYNTSLLTFERATTNTKSEEHATKTSHAKYIASIVFASLFIGGCAEMGHHRPNTIADVHADLVNNVLTKKLVVLTMPVKAQYEVGAGFMMNTLYLICCRASTSSMPSAMAVSIIAT